MAPLFPARILIILGSSRSGSSFLFDLLVQSAQFISGHGEETPFFRRHGVGWINSRFESDATAAELTSDQVLSLHRDLASDWIVGPGDHKDQLLAHRQAEQRLSLQWPNRTNFSEALAHWQTGRLQEWRKVLQSLNIDESYYDLPGLVPLRSKKVPLPDRFFEELPYLVPRWGKTPTAFDLSEKPLLLKTSSHAYRIPWLKKLFPHSEFRFVMLTRHPVSAINGLIDGWHSNAFHSHNLRDVGPLNIRGYADKVWWKFDLPPGWHDWRNEPLAQVCAMQWFSAYTHIAEALRKESFVLKIRFEDLMDPDKRAETLSRLFAFAGIPGTTINLFDRPPIMASKPPRPG